MRKMKFEGLEGRLMMSGNPGDFNGDFVVDNADLQAWAAQYGLSQEQVNFIIEWQQSYGNEYYDASREPIHLHSGEMIPAFGSGGEVVTDVLSGDHDKVLIPAGKHVVVDGEANVRELYVEGTLDLNGGTLRSETILVTGEFQAVSGVVEFSGEVPDEGQFGLGLIVTGKLSLFGDTPDDIYETVPYTNMEIHAPQAYELVIRTAEGSPARAHVMVAGMAQVHVENTLFQRLGRTTNAPLDGLSGQGNIPGRYSFHLHHVMTEPVFSYNRIDGGERWGLVIHNTSYGQFVGNVVSNVQGAGIVLEAGSEIGNAVNDNVIFNVPGTPGATPYTRLQDEFGAFDQGIEGNGIWSRSTVSNLDDNVVSNVGNAGILIWARDDRIDDVVLPDGTKLNSQSTSFALDGLLVYRARVGWESHGIGRKNESSTLVLENVVTRNCIGGIEVKYGMHTMIRNADIDCNDSRESRGIRFDRFNRTASVVDSTIKDVKIGLDTSVDLYFENVAITAKWSDVNQDQGAEILAELPGIWN